MRPLLYLAFGLFLTAKAYSQSNYIDPTGAYEFEMVTHKDGTVYGRMGKINVKKLGQDKIVMTLWTSLGAPDYNFGGFVDTLDYKQNQTIYKASFDTSCRITFNFTDKGVMVKQTSKKYFGSCDFGHLVSADGFYHKISSAEPELRDPFTGETIE